MFGAFDISASALTAQHQRLNAISSNIANIDTVNAGTAPDGTVTPYRRVFAVLESQRNADGSAGVRVSKLQQDQSPFAEKYEPWSRYADSRGIVKYPNVDLFYESTDALEASRAYEANITAIETTKSMLNATLRVLA